MAVPIGMIAIAIEKGTLVVEATRISHMVIDHDSKSFVHLKSGEEFALPVGTSGAIAAEYDRLARLARIARSDVKINSKLC